MMAVEIRGADPDMATIAAMSKPIIVRLFVSREERASWQAAADAAEIALSEYIRRRVNGNMTVTIEAPPPPAAAPTPKRKRSK